MPAKSEIDRIMARAGQEGRTGKWRRYPARSGPRKARPERPPMISASADFKAIGGEVMVEVHVSNRTGHEVTFFATVDHDRHEIIADANGGGTALFTVRPQGKVIVRDGGTQGPILYEGIAPSIGQESFA